MNSKFTPILVILSVLFLSSCDQGRVYEKNIKVPDGIWTQENIVRFEVMIDDTSSSHNLYVNVRNTSFYETSNLYIFITTIAPNGNSVKDKFEIILADDRGRWLGSGLGDIWDLQLLYKQNIRFAQKGRYVFEFQHGMRPDRIPFILDVGLRVEKAKS